MANHRMSARCIAIFHFVCLTFGVLVVGLTAIAAMSQPKWDSLMYDVRKALVPREAAYGVTRTIFWASVGAAWVTLMLEMVAAHNLFRATQKGANPASALRHADLWKVLVAGLTLVSVLRNLGFAVWLNPKALLPNICWLPVLIYVGVRCWWILGVEGFRKELKARIGNNGLASDGDHGNPEDIKLFSDGIKVETV